jgi:two-component sensor histidine kinase
LIVSVYSEAFAQAFKPTASFLFNGRNSVDSTAKISPKLVGVNFCEDRFGNANNALYVFGNEFSYANLGNSSLLKPRVGSISLWVKIEREVATGWGYNVNPIILTKNERNDDFFEAYGIYYQFENNRVNASAARDSLRQSVVVSKEKFSLYQWHHLVVTYDDDYFCFYVDGKLQRRAIKQFETVFLENDSVMVGISANKKNSRYMEGAVDDIHFFDKVLSDDDVVQLYHAPNPNRFNVIVNYVLLALAVVILIVILYFIIRFQLNRKVLKAKKQMELTVTLMETELRVNRALMNPHFIFNSLNAVHNLILSNENDKANHYLLKFSKLIRKLLESNASESISLETEIDILNRYLEVESLRFDEALNYVINVSSALNPSTIRIPIMMLQPFVENAVWHGLMPKTGEKNIAISFTLHLEEYILCVIEDNGLGRRKNVKLSSDKKPLATIFVQNRLDLINKIHDLKCSIHIEDKIDPSGTIVKLILPNYNTFQK